ncbi:uncharacterized protein LOC134842878 [Symsagittifera roscoffensis]|uniref:uncharacterized protein LOC134842878 n=1 Tax=Symsagittifera roscoffensis TaxID=84072 RepID=UPI00307B9E53
MQPLSNFLSWILWILFCLVTRLAFATHPGSHTWQPRAPAANWESLVFWLANGVGKYGDTCRKRSDYYCLEGYIAPLINSNHFMDNHPGGDARTCVRWFETLAWENWRPINFIDSKNPEICCTGQVAQYMRNGFLNRRMSPDEYMFKLTDYTNESKPLNLLSAIHLPWLCVNVIMIVGFGPGPLRRDHHPNIVHGAPYIIAGKDYPGTGIPDIDTKVVNFENPGEDLTFHWFKHNVMCRDNPWICVE